MDSSNYDVTDELEFWIDIEFSFAAFKTAKDGWLICCPQISNIATVGDL